MKKKLIAAATGILTPLAVAFPAFADIDICPGGEFADLCEFEADQFPQLIGAIVQILFIVAVIIAVFFLIWGGIKWIMSGGDKSKVESARNTIIGGIIGLIFVFLTFFILQVVAGLFGIDIQNLELPPLFG